MGIQKPADPERACALVPDSLAAGRRCAARGAPLAAGSRCPRSAQASRGGRGPAAYSPHGKQTISQQIWTFSTDLGFDKQTSFPRAASRADIVSRLASAGARVRSRCAAGHARLPCDDPSAARYFERRCVCLILAVGVHLRYRTSQSTLQPGVFRRHAHSENSNSHTHEMYYQRFVGLSAQLREKQGLQTSTSSSARR